MLDERNPSPDRGLGTAVLAAMGATALGAALFLLATWNSPHVAHKLAPITVGSSTRPVVFQNKVVSGAPWLRRGWLTSDLGHKPTFRRDQRMSALPHLLGVEQTWSRRRPMSPLTQRRHVTRPDSDTA
jgi:hypothetical protein